MTFEELCVLTIKVFGLVLAWVLIGGLAFLGGLIWYIALVQLSKRFYATYSNTRVFAVWLRVLRKHKVGYQGRRKSDVIRL